MYQPDLVIAFNPVKISAQPQSHPEPAKPSITAMAKKTSLSRTAWKKGRACLTALLLAISAVLDLHAGQLSYSGKNGLPEGFSMEGAAYGNNAFVVVGSGGYILRSTDGQTWSVVKDGSFINTTYNSATFAQGLFVATAQNGSIVTSPDGASWAIQSSGTANSLNKVAYLNGKFYAVGQLGTVLTSLNATNWSAQNLSSTNDFNNLAYGNGKYLMGSYTSGGGYLFSSTTGASPWTSSQIETTDGGIINFIGFLNNKFFACMIDATNFSSPDGSTWTPIKSKPITNPNQVFGGIYANGTYYFFGSDTNGTYGAIDTSTDGTNFTELLPKTITDGIISMAYGNGTFVEAGNSGWSTSTDANHWRYPAGNYYSVAYNGTNYVAVGYNGGDGYITTSPDWVNWTNTTPPVRIQGLASVVASQGKFVAVGYSGSGLSYPPIVTSTDGYNWTVTNTTITGGTVAVDDFVSIAADGNGTLVAVGDGGHVIRSTDNGVTWSVVTPTLPANATGLNSVTYANSQFVAVGSGGAVIYSTDGGASWSDASYPGDTGAYFNSITYGSGGYVLIGADSTNNLTFLLKRTSLTSGSWAVPATPPPAVLYPSYGWFVTYANGSYLGYYNDTNNEAYLFTSSDGNTWVRNDLNSMPNIMGSTYANGSFYLVGLFDFKGMASIASFPPGITSALSANATNGSAFSYTITASNSPTSFGASGLPGGLGINTANGVISGTPTVSGSFGVTISATNGAGAGTATLTLSIADTNTQPLFVGSTTTLLVGENASATDIKSLLHVNDPDSGQTETWSQYSAPAHGTLAFSSATAASGSANITPGGTITYAPAANYSGPDSFIVQVGDGHGGTANRTITVTVNPPTGITSSLSASGTNGSVFTYTITASNNPTSFGASGLPGGLVVNTANGVISGTPTVYGNFPVTISTTNATSFGSAILTLTILNSNIPPVFVGSTTTLLVGENAGATDLRGLLHVNDPDAGQTETWSQFSAPAHGTLSFSSATAAGGNANITPGGTITYAPAANYFGSDSFTVQVSDGNGGLANRTITVTVNPPPGITSIASGNATYGSTYTYTITASNSPVSFGAGGLPAGLAVNAVSGVISGTPTQSGIYPILISATNATSFGTATLTLNIALADITISGITASNKIYNGNTTAALNLTGAALQGIVNSDSISLNTTGVTAAFTDANVGTNKTVTITGLTLSGTAATNYTVTQPTALADIIATPAIVTLHRSVQLYDGSPKSVTATTLPLGLPVNLTYNGSPTHPVGIGAYTVIGNVANPNFSGSATNYLYIAPAPQFTHVSTNGTNILFSWSALPPVNYQVIYTPSLLPASWNNLGGPVNATNPVMSALDGIDTSLPARFYRVKIILE